MVRNRPHLNQKVVHPLTELSPSLKLLTSLCYSDRVKRLGFINAEWLPWGFFPYSVFDKSDWLTQQFPGWCYAPPPGFLNLLTVSSPICLLALFRASPLLGFAFQSLSFENQYYITAAYPFTLLVMAALQNYKTPRKIPDQFVLYYQTPTPRCWWSPKANHNLQANRDYGSKAFSLSRVLHIPSWADFHPPSLYAIRYQSRRKVSVAIRSLLR